MRGISTSVSEQSEKLESASAGRLQLPAVELNFVELKERIAQGDRLLVQCVSNRNERYDTEFSQTIGKLPLGAMGVSIVLFDTADAAASQVLKDWEVTSLPALVLFSEGKHCSTHLGLADPAELEAKIRSCLQC